jgi:hypothetical protein
MISALLALSLAAGAGAEAPARDDPYVVALVVGLNLSRDPQVRALSYADDDAARYAELFEGVADKVLLLTVLDPESQERHKDAARSARPPSRLELDRAVAQLAKDVAAAQAAGRRTELFFVYAGHGKLTSDKEGSVNLLDGVLLRRDLFKSVLDPIPAQYKHVIIDACDAYFMVAKRGEGTPSDADKVKAFLDKEALDGHPEVGVLISGSREVQTHEWSALESGVFSHEIRSALLGGADADGDGVLRYAEIAAFVSAANDGLADARARVEVFARPPAMDLAHPVMDLRRGPRRFIEIPSVLKGQVRIEDSRGVRYADVNASGESPVYVRLVGNEEYFVFRNAREARVPGSAQGILTVADASFGPPRRSARGPVEDDLRKGLFSVPYGMGFVRGYVARDPSLGVMPPPQQVFPDIGYVRSEVSSLPPGTIARRAGWITLGGGVLLGGGAAISAVVARNQYDAFLKRLAVEGTWDAKQIEEVENWRLSTNLFLAGSIAAGATGLLLLFLSDSPTGPRVAFAPGPSASFLVDF